MASTLTILLSGLSAVLTAAAWEACSPRVQKRIAANVARVCAIIDETQMQTA